MISRRGFLMMTAAASVATACSSRTATKPTTSPPLPPALEMKFAPTQTDVDLGGPVVRTWSYTDRLPGNEIRIRKGQRLRAVVSNNLPAETSIHWHGMSIPNDMDGVPPLTQSPIPAGGQFTYDFVVPDAGTYWYHSHVGTQLDRGLYGALIVDDPGEKVDYDDELVLVLDDWIDGTGTNPDQVLVNLRGAGMTPMKPGGPGVGPTTPLGSDGGDVTYPHFLINGRVPADPDMRDYRDGQRVRLRVINAGSDTAFRVAVPGTPLNVIAADGYPVMPTHAKSVILGMGERFDAIFTVSGSVPVVAVPEDKQGHAQLNIRVATKASTLNVDDVVESVRNDLPLNTATLLPTPEVTLPERQPDQVIDVKLSGPDPGYTWPFNGRLYDPLTNGIAVKRDLRVRMRMVNESMMFHPIHLHGHTFQVVGRQEAHARKDTVLVGPKQTVEVDFTTDNPGKWITHCHNTYHLEGGMAGWIFYEG